MSDVEVGLKKELKVIKSEEIHHLLELGELGAVLEWTVTDPKTGEVLEHKVKKSESFVQQFLQLLFVKMANSPRNSPVSIRDTSNNLKDVYKLTGAQSYHFYINALAGDVTFGIIIGSNNTAPTISDYKINTLIVHATMNYSASIISNPAADATTSEITTTRNFTNVSGGPVTVEEVALYCGAYADDVKNFCIIRDITGGIVVPNGTTLTMNYRPQATV